MRPEKKIKLNGCIERNFTVTDTGDMNVRKPEWNGYSADSAYITEHYHSSRWS